MTTRLIRPARFDLNVPLTFKTEDGVLYGHCVNISTSGMLAVFNPEVQLFTQGEIALETGEYFVNITARVARVLGSDHGLAFKIDSDSDRRTIQVLIEYATATHQPDQSTNE